MWCNESVGCFLILRFQYSLIWKKYSCKNVKICRLFKQIFFYKLNARAKAGLKNQSYTLNSEGVQFRQVIYLPQTGVFLIGYILFETITVSGLQLVL